MSGRAFFDTNVVVYAFAQDDPRADAAEALLAAGGVVSVQVLNEFCAVARGKLRMSWDEVAEALAAIRAVCREVAPLTVETHETAVDLARRHGYRIYDALILAAALRAGCEVLYSEDMRSGRRLGALEIRNPFAPG